MPISIIRFFNGLVLAGLLAIVGCSSGSNSTQVTQTAPAIAWATPAAIVYGTALSATQLDATASVAGSFSYSPSLGAVLAAGSQTLSVTFTPTDTADYKTATASVTLTVSQATPALTWATPAPVPYGTVLSSAQLDAIANTAGSFSYSPALGTVLAVGSQSLSVTFTPMDALDYNTATASVTLMVTKPATSLTWPAPAAIPYGTALSSAQLDATSNVPGSFVYSPALGSVLQAGSHTLSVTFTPTDTADYQSATDSVMLTVNQAFPVLTWPAPATIVAGTALGSAQLDATANVFGSFSYSPVAGTVLAAGTQMLSVTFTPADATDYTTATGTVSLIVIPAAGTALVDFGTAEQTIRGFGGSTAWLGQLTVAQASALFSSTSGLGLSILRMRIDPTGSSSNGWVTPNWAQEVANAQEAVAANPNAVVFASPWTPPASLKASSTAQPYYSGACSPASGYCGGYLNPSNYAAYAAYLEDFVSYFNTNSGFGLYAISMQNEPDYADVNYESCYWTAAQMDAWISSLTAGGATDPLTARLIVPESFQFIPAQAQTALDDPNAEGNISIVGGHLYGVMPAPYTIPSQDDQGTLDDGALPESGGGSTGDRRCAGGGRRDS